MNTKVIDQGSSKNNPASGPAREKKQFKKNKLAETASNEFNNSPNIGQEIQKAIDLVPIKDYSEYEISLESKTVYEDALFSDEESLNKALKQSAIDSQSSNVEPPPAPTDSEKPAIQQESKTAPEIDYSSFFTSMDKSRPLKQINNVPEIALSLSSKQQGLNNSPLVSKNYDVNTNFQTDPLVANVDTQIEQTRVFSPEQQSKTLADKILSKAKIQLNKSKSDFNQYIGRSLPERTLALDFTFPPQKSKKAFKSIVSSYDIKKLIDTMGKSNLALLTQAEKDLSDLVKCEMSASHQLSLLDAYSGVITDKAREVISLFQRNPTSLAKSKRFGTAEKAQQALKYLISGYKQVYAAYYEAKNILYGTHRNTANRVAFKLIDLLLLEQMLVTACQSPLHSNSIKTINTLFSALSLYEYELISTPQYCSAEDRESTIKTMFLKYQAGLVFDYNCISSSLHKVLNEYIDEILGLLTLLPINQPINPTILALWSICPGSNSAPKFLATPDVQQQPGEITTMIAVAAFYNAIRNDYAASIQRLSGKRVKYSTDSLNKIKPSYTAALLSELNRSIAMNEQNRIVDNYTVFKPIQLKAYSGLPQCIAYFNWQHCLNNKKAVPKDELSKSLPEKPACSASQWLCAMEDEQFLLLQTNEVKAAIAIDIGHLLLLIRPAHKADSTDEGPKNELKLLTRVVRMERGSEGKLTIKVKRLSSHITHCELLAGSNESKTALLAVRSDQRLLITDVKNSHYSSQSLKVRLPDATEAVVAIEGLSAITQKIQCLSLSER